VVAALVALVGHSAPSFALSNPTLPASGCLGSKIKCVIKKKACLLGLYKKGLTLDPAKVEKCKAGFSNPATGKGCFDKADAKNAGCLTLGDGPAIEAKIDAHVDDVVAEIYPGGAFAKCQGGKIGCVIKYNGCILGAYAKAAKAGGTHGDVSKCTAGIASCISKLDGKGGCNTTADGAALQNKDDAFIDDVIGEIVKGTDQNNQRCTADTSVHCTNAPGGVGGPCTGLGTCEYFFGAPLSLAAGGVTTCVASQWAGGISGTFNQQSGASVGQASIISRVYNGIAIANPCPRCIGDGFINDGVKGGSCNGGARNGMPCDGEGPSPEPAFGITSLDCPPTAGGLIATLPIDLANTTASLTKTVDGTSPTCNGEAGKRCLCGSCSGNSSFPCDHDTQCATAGFGTCTNAAGEPRKTNACLDDTTTGVNEHVCAIDTSSPGEGQCAAGPITTHCHIETFRGCTVPADCPFAGDTCDAVNRDCFPGTGNGVGDAITAIGSHGVPRDHTNTQTFASVFCVAPTGSASVNSVAGLPGPGRLALAGVGAENGTAGTCPTQASFLPTTKLGVLDSGWTGISHDAKVIGGGKVTVSVTGCTTAVPDGNGNCGTCTYTGPIANANAVP